MDEAFRAAIALFNDGRYAEFQDALEALISSTRAVSDRQFFAVLDNLAESLLQLSDGDADEAEDILNLALRKLDEFVPRFRGINVEALREDFRRLMMELRQKRGEPEADLAPARLPRLRILGG